VLPLPIFPWPGFPLPSFPVPAFTFLLLALLSMWAQLGGRVPVWGPEKCLGRVLWCELVAPTSSAGPMYTEDAAGVG